MGHVRRNYGQYCGLAAALDVIGERWTLLIIRELLLGPRRYGELLEALPGIGTNLLAERLKVLHELGVITRPQSRDQGYALTELGRELREPVLSMARWGLHFLDAPTPDVETRAHWGFLAVQAMIDPERATEIDESYEFRVDDVVFHISVTHGKPVALEGPADGEPAVVASTDARTFVEIGAKRLTPFEALASGRLQLTGDTDAIVRSSVLLGLMAPAE
ncbi:winged helix-turn-helix transcriptional regulator [Herbidospora sp. NBRC 101105]|uniref:winged helix-turn-helix transcriptional regulator n=1 Tax=Herbidospora sp. NBRC 101105 TaxID=3032195 RepID=UPI0024A54CDF|nr:winged helix-turn-helix transcriptional regulator [Herbidospora sp. NBRC 101105]GLX99567.1 transcriptional regulator [Herbidospora sp. NBRC 101105]